jgi:hypothetical protein
MGSLDSNVALHQSCFLVARASHVASPSERDVAAPRANGLGTQAQRVPT